MLVYYLPHLLLQEPRVALNIKGAFDSVWWRGLLAHLQSIGFHDKAISLFESYLSNWVVTPLKSSNLHAGVPQFMYLSTCHCGEALFDSGICRRPYFAKDYPRQMTVLQLPYN